LPTERWWVSVLYREPKLLKSHTLFFLPLAVLALVPLS